MAYTPNDNFDEYLSTTLNNHRASLIDNVFDARVLGYFMKDSGSVKISGGQKIVRPVNLVKNSASGFYAMTGQLSSADSDGPTAAEWPWKIHSASVKIYGLEEARNNGEAAILDLLSTRVTQAEETIVDDWNTAFLADTPGANDFNSLPAMLKDDLTARTVPAGNIDPSIAGNEGWKVGYIDNTAEAISLSRMRTAYNSATIGADSPNIILTSQALFEKYEALLQADIRYEDVAAANAGFQSLMFKGTPISYDTAVGADDVWFLNTKYIEFVVSSEKFMTPTPFVRPPDYDYRIAQIMTYGNLTCTSRRKQALLTAKT